jgi:hypothetical protein
LLIGLSVTARSEFAEETAGDLDLPVQNFRIDENTEKSFTFRVKTASLLSRSHMIVGLWLQSYLHNCSDGRAGCVDYAYALGSPERKPEVCDGIPPPVPDEQVQKYAICRLGEQHLVAFR